MKREFLKGSLRRKISSAVAILLLLVGCYFGAKRLTITHLAHAQVRATPFFLQLHVYNVQKNKLSHMRAIARRSDGTTVLLQSVGPIDSGHTMRKITFMDGRAITVSDLLRTRTTIRQLNEEIAFLRKMLVDPPQDCRTSGQVFLRRESILGQNVAVWQLDVANRRITIWQAPALGCELLQYRSEIKQADGSFQTEAEARPVLFRLGEPDPAVFDPKSDYDEMKPSEVQRRVLEKMGLPADSVDQRQTEKLDQLYRERH